MILILFTSFMAGSNFLRLRRRDFLVYLDFRYLYAMFSPSSILFRVRFQVYSAPPRLISSRFNPAKIARAVCGGPLPPVTFTATSPMIP